MERTVGVDVIAWVFIALAGPGIAASILQLLLMPPLQFTGHPGIALFEHMKAIIATKLILMSILLVSSAGLLRRSNPARIAFIVVTLFCIAWHVADLILRTWLGMSISLLPGGVNHAHVPASFCLASIWTVWALTKPAVRAEFIEPSTAASPPAV